MAAKLGYTQPKNKDNKCPHTSPGIEMAVGRSRIELNSQQVDNQYYKLERTNWQKKGRETQNTMADDITDLTGNE